MNLLPKETSQINSLGKKSYLFVYDNDFGDDDDDDDLDESKTLTKQKLYSFT